MADLIIRQASNLGVGHWFNARDALPDFSAKMRAVEVEKRQDSGEDTINLFIDARDPDNEYAVSIVNACVSETVYAIQCTSGTEDGCGSNGPVQTFTENASEYKLKGAATTTTAGVEVKATAIEHCDLDGTTSATCTATVIGSAKGTKVTTTTTSAFTQNRYDVSITAGSQKLANPTGKCTSAAAKSVSSRGVMLLGLVGAVGAISALAL